MLSERMMRWVKDETAVTSEEAKMSMESYAMQIGIFEEDVKQLVGMAKITLAWLMNELVDIGSIANVRERADAYSSHIAGLKDALAPFVNNK